MYKWLNNLTHNGMCRCKLKCHLVYYILLCIVFQYILRRLFTSSSSSSSYHLTKPIPIINKCHTNLVELRVYRFDRSTPSLHTDVLYCYCGAVIFKWSVNNFFFKRPKLFGFMFALSAGAHVFFFCYLRRTLYGFLFHYIHSNCTNIHCVVQLLSWFCFCLIFINFNNKYA